MASKAVLTGEKWETFEAYGQDIRERAEHIRKLAVQVRAAENDVQYTARRLLAI